MADVPEARRHLREQGAPMAGATATVDVADLLSKLAERTEELAEARVRQEHAEAALKKSAREWDSERQAHAAARERLESDRRELEAECTQVGAECRELEAELAQEREARSEVEADLRRMQDRLASLQQQLKIAWAQLQEGGNGPERRRGRSRLGS